MNRRLTSAFSGAVLAASACQIAGPPVTKPAVLVRTDAATMDRLKAALAKAMGRAHVELGAGDPTQSPELSILPRPLGPYEDRSLARPTIFRLEIEGSSCFVARQGEAGASSARERVDGVECRAVG
jgi:hypothetical protein